MAEFGLGNATTATFGVLFGFLILAHDRRRVLHFNVTANPTAEWTARQLVLVDVPAQRDRPDDLRERVQCVAHAEARRYVADFPLSKAGYLEWQYLPIQAPLPIETLMDASVDLAAPYDRTTGR